jgi:predicted dehydrogenase
MLPRKLRFGMIGGGRGAFIGAVHRIAARMDGQAELVAGAFSSDPARAKASAADLFVSPERAYGSYEEMAAAEARMPADRRLDFVAIVTPNHEHYGPAKLFLEAGFNVVLDKPLAFDLEQATRLRDVVRWSGKVFVLTHNYVGNAMVKQAQELVAAGVLGEIRKVVAEYSQGWLALKDPGQIPGLWRADPARSGASGCMGDIGTHAEHLVRYITGLHIDELCADLTTFTPGGRLEDDGNILLRFEGGARGVLHASQVCIGEENNLNVRVYGSKASLEWHQERPNELVVSHRDRPREVWRRANDYLGARARSAGRIPTGHQEGYLEAFGNIYREAFRAIAAEVEGMESPQDLDLPTIDDGVAGMVFVHTALESARTGGKWVKLLLT